MRALGHATSSIVFAIGLLVAVDAADGPPGAVSGRVVDEGGSPVAGATVTARNLATGYRESAISDPSGAYRIEKLPGTYDVIATELAL